MYNWKVSQLAFGTEISIFHMIIVMTQSQSKLMLLMEEILHQLIWRIHHYLKGSIYLRWLAGCLSSTVCQSRWTCSPRWNLPGIFGRHCAAVSNDSRGSFEGWHLQGMKKTHPVGWILGREKYKKSVVPLYGLIFFDLFHSQTYLTTEMPGQAAGSPGICERTQWHCGFCRISFPYLSNS